MGLEHNPLLQKDILKIVQDMLDKLSHEDLQELLGGDENGHYHLTKDQFDKLVEVIKNIFVINPDGTVTLNHEKLSNLLGGDKNGHYHLTKDQSEKLVKLIQQNIFITNPDGTITLNHEKLSNLLGGDKNGHYHLSASEREKIINIINEFIPLGETEPYLGFVDHEELGNLLGGNANGHYHLTSAEYSNLANLSSSNTNITERLNNFINVYNEHVNRFSEHVQANNDFVKVYNQHVSSTNPHPNLKLNNLTGNLDGSKITGTLSNVKIPNANVEGLANLIKNTGGGITDINVSKNGYGNFSNGLQLRWGSVDLVIIYANIFFGVANLYRGAFAQKFSHECLNVQITHRAPNNVSYMSGGNTYTTPALQGGELITPVLDSFDTTGFYYKFVFASDVAKKMGTFGLWTVDFFAIGY